MTPAILLAAALVQAPAACAPEGDLQFICGLTNVEDLLPIDGGRLLIGSSFKEGSAGLYRIDAVAKTGRALELSLADKPDAIYADCPGPPDLAKLATQGLDVLVGRNGAAMVYAVNRGGRDSIEVFRLDAFRDSARWVGCVVMPEGTSPNAVVALADFSLLVTKLFDTRDPRNGAGAEVQTRVSGLVYHWVPGRGFNVVPGSEFSGDNGLVATRDGKTLFVAAHNTRQVWRIPLSGEGERAVAEFDFNPDNLRWAPGGGLLVAGQYLGAVRRPGPKDWGAARLDPKTMAVTPVIKAAGTETFDNASTAVQTGRTLFFSTFSGDRIAWKTLP